MFADGFSMAISNYLSTKSQREVSTKHVRHYHFRKTPLNTAIVTFFSFLIIGFIPLLSFVLAIFIPSLKESQFIYSGILTALAFLMVGWVRGSMTEKHPVRTALETLAIGIVAASLAFGVGFLLRGLVG